MNSINNGKIKIEKTIHPLYCTFNPLLYSTPLDLLPTYPPASFLPPNLRTVLTLSLKRWNSASLTVQRPGNGTFFCIFVTKLSYLLCRGSLLLHFCCLHVLLGLSVGVGALVFGCWLFHLFYWSFFLLVLHCLDFWFDFVDRKAAEIVRQESLAWLLGSAGFEAFVLVCWNAFLLGWYDRDEVFGSGNIFPTIFCPFCKL